MRKLIACLLCFFCIQLPAFAAESGYWDNLHYDLIRGFKNMVGSPLEIPAAIKEKHVAPGTPGVKETWGLVVGAFRTVERASCGAWDYIVGWIPGQQEGLLLDPETLF